MIPERIHTDAEIESFADLLASLPKVRTLADAEALPADTLGIQVFSLTDETLRRLAERTPNIRYLAGDGNCRLTDAGASVLSRFTLLEWLDLEWSSITDAALDVIGRMPALRWVDVCDSAVTQTGVARLRQSCPHLQVEVFEPS